MSTKKTETVEPIEVPKQKPLNEMTREELTKLGVDKDLIEDYYGEIENG